MKKMSKRLLSLLLAVIMVAGVLPVMASAEDAAETATYMKVTEEPTDWTGTYLLVYDDENATTDYAFDGSLSSLDAVNNYAAVTIADDKIEANTQLQVTLESTNGGYLMKTSTAKYVYATSDKNSLTSTEDAATAANYPLTLNFVDGNVDIVSSKAHMRFNAANDQMRFRFYKSTSYTNQKAVTLYKLEESAGAGHVVINQAYGGGGNSGAEYKNDFIELYNPTNQPVDLTGWSVQYASKAGSFGGNITNLTGTIKAHGFYLIQEAAGSGGTKDLPTPDATGSINMSAKEFKLALVKSTEAIGGKDDANVVDFLGVGGADACEGNGAAPILSNTTAAVRKTDGVDTDDNAADFMAAEPSPRNSTYTGSDPDPDPVPDPTVVPISTALAGEAGTKFTVKGVVTLVDGKNIYVQDATGGIDLYFGAAPTDIALGDTLIASGMRADYNGLPELTGAIYEKSSGLTLTAKNTTIGALTNADICTYVKLTGVEITEVYDKDGTYSNPNITVTDGSNTIQLYKAVINKVDGAWEYKVGDVIDITAAVGVYKTTTLQLRNTQATEIRLTPDNTYPDIDAKYSIYAPVDAPADGDTVVMFNAGNGFGVSSEIMSSYYLTPVALTPDTAHDGVIATDSETVGWRVSVKDGVYTFSQGDKVLTLGQNNGKYNLNTASNGTTGWKLEDANEQNHSYYVSANGVTGEYGSVYIEYYAKYKEFSAYCTSTNRLTEKDFGFTFYKLVREGKEETGGMPNAGDQVVIYNLSAEGVLSLQDDNTDSPAITGVSATVEDGKATAANGGLIFTVEKNGDYYRFKNDTFGYLCSNGTGNNAFYNSEVSEDADWTLAVQGTGYTMESRTAKYNGKYSQYLEYYADSYKTYSMYNVTDYDIYTFQFYPCGNDTEDITGGVVNKPTVDFGTLPAAHAGADYTFSFTVDAVFGVQELTVKVGGHVLPVNENGSYTIAAELVKGESLTITVTGTDKKGVAIGGTATVTVVDEPVISDLTPTAGSETGENKRPTISAKITNAGENPTVTMTVNGTQVGSGYNTATGEVSYTPANDLADGRTTVTVAVTRADGKTASKSWSFTVGKAQYQLYFGQLHSHTGEYSDGSGTLASALDYIKNLPESANVDFVAFTDHSNYFDASGAANPEGALYDMSLATEQAQRKWSAYKNTVAEFNAGQSDVIAIAGFEMTWSGGPGHINTFNTPGIVSRNNTTLNNKTDDAGMKAYYALLSQPEGAESLSQFNHPGSTFGTFSDFAYWDPVIDTRMYMVEVGNGEGAIGAGGYYPSYEYYTMALDKGWHLAPTNNQDNHKGKWGNANDARDVILTDDFSEEGLYDAIRAMKMYATEDKNLEIGYTVNDLPLGSSIKDVPETLNINVTVNDPDSTDSISKVEVIVNSGKVAYTWSDPAELATGELKVTLSPDYSYYYIRVTEGDGDLAVTAPVWVGEALKLGISSVECGTSTPVTGEELTLTTTLFNSEVTDAAVKSLSYTVKGSETVLGTDTTDYTVPASGTLAVDFKYTPDVAKVMTVTVTAVIEQNGKEYTFTKDIELDILNADSLVYIGIDASHYNEYVAGNYKDSMGNFGELAAGYSVRTVELKTSAELLAACSNEKYKAIVLTAPSRRNGSALRDPYATYSDNEIEALVAFNNNGGAVILCGWGDYYESYAVFPAEDHMAAQQNKVLTALGSSLRISDDETKDNTWNGGQAQRLYFSSYNFDSFLLDGVEYDAENPHNNMYTELYSQYGGASIYAIDAAGDPSSTVPGTVTPVVYGFDTTYSSDDDEDSYGGLGRIPKYAFDGAERLMVMATEQIPGRGLIVVAGAAFLSNFEVQATISDSGSEKNYSNYKICENLVKFLNPVTVTDIAAVRAQTEAGYKYTIEGVVTSNASGYDKDTAFFDCIYVQDATGGICCFPVAGNYRIGDVVQITGTTDFYQGEPELQVTNIKKIGETAPVEPAAVTAAQVNSRSVEGKLITVSGTVTKIIMANGLPESIYIKDSSGSVARVFIDGYITKDKAIANLAVGCSITATGLASYDNTYADTGAFPRIRVRDRADVVCTAGGDSGETEPPVIPPVVLPGTPVIPTAPGSALPFTDVRSTDWFYEDVKYVYDEGLMNGTGKTKFSPNADLTRAMVVTVLYRIENEPVTGKADMFGDVSGGQWYTKAVAWAAENGIVNGYSNGNFGPNDPITREQLATILYRYTKFKSGSVEASRNYLNSFSDAGQVSTYAVEAMNWAVAGGLINGSGDKLMPTARASRAQVAAIIHRYLEG